MSPRPDPPAASEEALARAREHARRAAAEAVAALRALLDAAALATTGTAVGESGMLGGTARGLDEIRALLEPGGPAPAALLEALAEALGAEIARWETKSASDPEARAVLRAFLGLRELLWEMGVRRSDGPPAAPPPPRRPEPAPAKARRVRHLRVEG